MAETKPAPKKGAPGKAGSTFTKKYGPLKGWQWVATIAAGGAVILYVRKARAGAAANSTTGATNATDAAAPPLEQLGSGVDSGAGSTGVGPGSDLIAQLLSNQSAQAAQIAAGDAKLQGENNRQRVQITALQKAIAKLTPKKQTAAKKVAAAKKPPAVKKNQTAKPAPKKPGGQIAPPPKAADLKAGMNYGAAVSKGLAPAPAKVK